MTNLERIRDERPDSMCVAFPMASKLHTTWLQVEKEAVSVRNWGDVGSKRVNVSITALLAMRRPCASRACLLSRAREIVPAGERITHDYDDYFP